MSDDAWMNHWETMRFYKHLNRGGTPENYVFSDEQPWRSGGQTSSAQGGNQSSNTSTGAHNSNQGSGQGSSRGATGGVAKGSNNTPSNRK